MDILSKIIKLFFGSKADKDRKEIMPYVEKIKAYILQYQRFQTMSFVRVLRR